MRTKAVDGDYYFRGVTPYSLVNILLLLLLLLRVFENRVLRRIFGPKKDEVTGGWRKLHNE
jgi:hypothetical protein